MKFKTQSDSSRILLLIIFLVALGAAGFIFFQVRTDRVAETLKTGAPLTLAFGVYDKDQLLMLEVLFYHPATKKTSLLDVPPETGDFLKRLGRMDAVSALFNPNDSKPLLEHLSGMIGVPVSFGFFFSASNFEKFVDLLGGMDLFISKDVENTSGDKILLLPSGTNLLDGSKARDCLVWSTEQDNSADRSSWFQKITQSLLRKMVDRKDYLLSGEVFPVFQPLVSGDWDDKALRTLVTSLAAADIESMIFQRTLGDERVVEGRTLVFPHDSNSLLKDTVKQTLDILKNANSEAASQLSTVIEIQNGTSRSGLASKAAQIFKSFGYEISDVKNAPDTNVEKTVVIDRKGARDKADKAAEIIKAQNVVSQKENFEDGSVDVTIILGKDFDGRYVRN